MKIINDPDLNITRVVMYDDKLKNVEKFRKVHFKKGLDITVHWVGH